MPPKGSRRGGSPARTRRGRSNTPTRTRRSSSARSKSGSRGSSKTARTKKSTSREKKTRATTPSRKAATRRKSSAPTRTSPRRSSKTRSGKSYKGSPAGTRKKKRTTRTKSRTRTLGEASFSRAQSPTRSRHEQRQQPQRSTVDSDDDESASDELSSEPELSDELELTGVSSSDDDSDTSEAKEVKRGKRTYPLNTVGIIRLENSELHPDISISKSDAAFSWNLSGTSRLARAVEEPEWPRYRSGQVIVIYIDIFRSARKVRVELERFISRLATQPELQKLATAAERKAIKGLASRSLCHLLRLLIADKKTKITIDDTIELEAGGDLAPGRPVEDLVQFYEKTFGFEVSPVDPIEQKEDAESDIEDGGLIKMHAPIRRVLEHCGKQSELEG